MENRRQFIKTSIVASSAVILPELTLGAGRLREVLILGDSISIGYTPYVQTMLGYLADVKRPMLDNGEPENCEGTTKGVQNIKRWLGTTKWDVIHFNFGLHDLKHVNPGTSESSRNPEDPLQADLKQYKKNLTEIVEILKETGADVIFATTTPYPNQTEGPLRDPGMAEKYNQVAIKIMNRNQITINDLYTFAKPRLDEIQLPNNVHFKDTGYWELAEKVINRITEALEDRRNRGM
ncbi:MAG TPA: SGNH/GDSL hydrolase family protein [Draconibacterium sp.]|nr:SGNH/GDSL hydrolase family protein [Draconibacterium sp.]